MVRRFDASLIALWLIFFLNGAVLSSWAPRIPEVQHELHLTDGVLGGALFGVAAGSVPALVATGALLRRAPGNAVCLLSSIVFAAALPLIALARNGIELGLVLAVLGAASGCLDVAMNTLGIRYEERRRSRVLSRLHGGYSLGVLAGTGAGALAAHFDVAVGLHFGAVAVLLSVVALGVSPLLPADATVPAIIARRRRPARLPLSVAALAVAALLMEGMIADWSALLVGRDHGGGTSLGAFTLTAFSCAMFISRSVGDGLVDRFGIRRMIRTGSVVLLAAIVAGLALSSPVCTLLAITISGLVLGPLFPLAVSAAGLAAPSDIATATAKVSAIGYLAFLGGPPLVGAGAELFSLPPTFALVTFACGITIAFGSRHRPLSIGDTEGDRNRSGERRGQK
ncbi:MFS transporter [Nocardia sp. NPDC052316]|uniref:MFS transporter n=1 Tax=Nocardia sp. NPDC052316 TaxID=3364329 RepID=UPI0037CABDC3